MPRVYAAGTLDVTVFLPFCYSKSGDLILPLFPGFLPAPATSRELKESLSDFSSPRRCPLQQVTA